MTVNIFEYKDYKKFTNDMILTLPKKGHGQYRKIAQFLNMSTVMISQVFKGDRDLSSEQGHKMSYFFNLSKLEREFFYQLVLYARAGTQDLREYYQEKIAELLERSKEVKSYINQDKTLSEVEKAKFYSNWYYSGVRLLTSLEQDVTTDAISERFGLSKQKVSEVLEFLLEHGLCIRDENQNIKMGPSLIHLESTSPYIKARQMDWRLKGFQKMDKKREDELFFTAPMSVSVSGGQKIRHELNQFIKTVSNIVVEEKPDTLRCLNIDFFEF